MFKELNVNNFKSVYKDKINLGRINVFIGENGSGKSNILEAVAFLSTFKESNGINNERLYGKGIRLAKPSLMLSSFSGTTRNKSFTIEISDDSGIEFNSKFSNSTNIEEPFITWQYTNLETNKSHDGISKIESPATILIKYFLIYSLNTKALRGIYNESKKEPLGINGENLDVLLASFDKEEWKKLLEYRYLIDWLDNFFVDSQDSLKLEGFKLNRSQSTLYFKDRFMMKRNNFFSSENSNEGILYVLFYLALLISKKTPRFFAIDNIETCLNPHLCREIMRVICELAKHYDKQILITTHNPAILDGLNLNDDEIRLFEVFRNDNGHTQTRRILINADNKPQKAKLSELWTRGYLGAISKKF